jgi:hypothetical protein
MAAWGKRRLVFFKVRFMKCKVGDCGNGTKDQKMILCPDHVRPYDFDALFFFCNNGMSSGEICLYRPHFSKPKIMNVFKYTFVSMIRFFRDVMYCQWPNVTEFTFQHDNKVFFVRWFFKHTTSPRRGWKKTPKFEVRFNVYFSEAGSRYYSWWSGSLLAGGLNARRLYKSFGVKGLIWLHCHFKLYLQASVVGGG